MTLQLQPDHRYGYEIGENDPIAQQPEKIRLTLKPHQIASLHKAILLEKYGKINYSVSEPETYLNQYRNVNIYGRRRAMYRNDYTLYSNVGILGDMVGYGKTLVALSIIASVPTREIHKTTEVIYTYNSSKAYIRVDCTKEEPVEQRNIFHTTLVVVPKGPVYVQWKEMLTNNTTLKYIAIDDLATIKKKCPPTGSTNEQLQAFFEGYDVVLVKNTNINKLIDYYAVPYQPNPIRGFARIMIDEAPDFLTQVPMLEYQFVWFITATFMMLSAMYGRAGHMSAIPRDLFNEERIYNVMVRCNVDFTKQSFAIPAYEEIIYTCVVPRYISIVQPFLTDAVLQMVNANDITGAIRELGGITETEDNIVKLVSKKLRRQIFNKQREKEYIESLDMVAELKEEQLRTINNELEKLQQKMADLETRIQNLMQDTCPICYDTLDNPIMLSCTHVFCGKCIMKWIETIDNMKLNNINAKRRCATCNTTFSKNDMVAVVKDVKDKKDKTEKKEEEANKPKTKIQTLINIIHNKPSGRFLIFSGHDGAFVEIAHELQHQQNITVYELKGTTQQMVKNLEKFKNGEIKVILLNTKYAGSGIDISCATDVILFHSMGEMSKQAIGRAQRVGRTDTLTVHKLYYPHEINTQ